MPLAETIAWMLTYPTSGLDAPRVLMNEDRSMTKRALPLLLLGCATLAAQQIPAPSDLPGSPFVIKKTWFVGGGGDSLTSMILDPARQRVFLAYHHAILVDDMESGEVAGKIPGTYGAYGIALDDTGEFGYVSDGRYNRIDVFDRRTLQVVGVVPTASNPTSVVFEPASGLVLAVCSEPAAEKPSGGEKVAGPRLPKDQGGRSDLTLQELGVPPHPPLAPSGPEKAAAPQESKWFLTVIDAGSWRVLAVVQLPGKVGFAQTGGGGHMYIGLPGKNAIFRIEADALGEKLRTDSRNAGAGGPTPKEVQLRLGHPFDPSPLWQPDTIRTLDWSAERIPAAQGADFVTPLPMEPDCVNARTVAVDERHLRLFAACDNMKLIVLNAANGDSIAALTTGPATSAVAYDFGNRLIYAANSGGNGSLTVIRQYVTDSYAVVQNLPVPLWARALAINPATGQVYLATDYSDSDAEHRSSSTGQDSFQLLLIGH